MTDISGAQQALPPIRPRQSGPPLIIPAVVAAALMITSIVLGVGLPRQGATSSVVLNYDLSHYTLLTVLGTIVFGTSIPLAIWTATVYRRLRQLGVTAPGTAIALSGGLLASAGLSLSGLLTWTTAQVAEAGQPGMSAVLSTLSFATGGAGFVVPFGLLLAGVAVPALILRLMPRPVAWAGLIIAGVAELATLSLLVPALDLLLPIGRFGGVLWLILVGLLLPISRQRRTTASRTVAAQPQPDQLTTT